MPPEKNSLQLQIASEFMLEALDWLGYSALNIGEGDLVFGDRVLKDLAAELSFPLLSLSVLFNHKPVFTTSTVVEVGGVNIAIAGLLWDGFSQYVRDHSDPGRPLDLLKTEKAITSGLEELGPDADLKVLLAHVPIPELRTLSESISGYDIVISGHDTDEYSITKPERAGGAFVVQTGWEGKTIGRLDVTLNRQGEITEVQGDYTTLDSSWPDHPQMTSLHEEYLDRVAEAVQEILNDYPVTAPPSGGRYMGSAECAACHQDTLNSWKKTKHAHAWRTLEEQRRDYDPECFACHTTGFQYHGGFRLVTETPGMTSVQCESCHGAGARHIEAPEKPYGSVDRSTCTKCHVPLHSPQFDYETYLPRIMNQSAR